MKALLVEHSICEEERESRNFLSLLPSRQRYCPILSVKMFLGFTRHLRFRFERAQNQTRRSEIDKFYG